MIKSISFNSMMAVAIIGTMVLSLFAYATQASAAVNSSSITITTTNRGTIDNDTSAKSHTGNNTALGSQGGRGGDAGDVTSGGDNNNGGATTGNGGSGGDGDAGGLVNTGDATSEAGTDNALNTTDIGVDFAVSGGDVNSTSLDIVTDNQNNNHECDCANVINNDTRARARSGDNRAEGSVGGNADDAGDVTGGSGDFNNGGADTGNGGNGGDGGFGGTVFTGNASSTAGTINLLNTSIIRVRI